MAEMATVDSLRKRVQRLQHRRAGTDTASGPDVSLTDTERHATLKAFYEMILFENRWHAEHAGTMTPEMENDFARAAAWIEVATLDDFCEMAGA